MLFSVIFSLVVLVYDYILDNLLVCIKPCVLIPAWNDSKHPACLNSRCFLHSPRNILYTCSWVWSLQSDPFHILQYECPHRVKLFLAGDHCPFSAMKGGWIMKLDFTKISQNKGWENDGGLKASDVWTDTKGLTDLWWVVRIYWLIDLWGYNVLFTRTAFF